MSPTAPFDVALTYLRRGWMPIPIPHRSKNPNFKNWSQFKISDAELPNYFNGHPQNIGILLGDASNDLVDVDLDTPEAVLLAPLFLPDTGSKFGRDSKRRSHWLYHTSLTTKKFRDPATAADKSEGDKGMLIELRSTGSQTVFPGSTHTSGEIITWDDDGEAAHVEAAVLEKRAGRLSAACLLARHWSKGLRNDMANALSGALLREGWSDGEAEHFIEGICLAAHDEETTSRVGTVADTAAKLRRGLPVTGWTTLAKLMDRRVVDKAREWLGTQGYDTQEATRETRENSYQPPLPVLHAGALYGIAGDFVRLVEPHSEADPVALLSQLLIGFGSLIGRGAHFTAEADKHFTNVFAVLVGDTGAGRKGTSWGQVKRALEQVDEKWARTCQAGGLASGEGLIYSVRDPVLSKKPIKAGGENTGFDKYEIADEGVEDKRLLVYEGEFASVLRAQGHEGNTLSMVIRNLWDTGDTRSMVKNKPTKATGAHVSIIGHITKDELLRCLDDVDSVNGYVNRFLWFVVRRSKFLPRGGRLSAEDLAPIVFHLRECAKFARTVTEMTFDEEAGVMWDEVYEGLETGRTGLLAKVTQRASPYVLRLSCLYALLDRSATVRREHLAAALALWKYCEDSARYIFGGRTGDKFTDDLLRALREAEADGLTRTDIHNLFGHNRKAARISDALASLAGAGLAHSRSERVDGSKRPTERWFATVGDSSTPYEINEFNEVNNGEADKVR